MNREYCFDSLPFDLKDKILKQAKRGIDIKKIKDKNDDDLLYRIYIEFLNDKNIDDDYEHTKHKYIYEWIENYLNPDYNNQYDIKIIDNIIEISGGIFVCIQIWIELFGGFNFRKTELENRTQCAYIVLDNYITDKVNAMNAISDTIRKNWSYIQ